MVKRRKRGLKLKYYLAFAVMLLIVGFISWTIGAKEKIPEPNPVECFDHYDDLVNCNVDLCINSGGSWQKGRGDFGACQCTGICGWEKDIGCACIVY